MRKRFGKITALNGLNLDVPRGVSAIIGPNGAGKTTLMHILLGLLKPDAGRSYVLGMDCWLQSFEVRKRVGALIEEPAYPPDLTGLRYLELVARFYGLKGSRQYAEYALKTVGLWQVRHRKIGKYSAGMLRRLGLARVLMGESELILLDEPTANLDPGGRIEVLKTIKVLRRDAGINFFISSHILPELSEVCEHVSIIYNGKIVEHGPVAELARNTDPPSTK